MRATRSNMAWCVARGVIACVLACATMGGCMRRQLVITSEPSGALVHVNDVEVGTTPVSVDFTYYGTYDVLLEKDGFEPLRTSASARAPIYEWPPLDLAASAIPANIETTVRWNFVLEPVLESRVKPEVHEKALVERARQMRGQLERK